ncbi:hypothetical protein PybrP1_007505 [[Pythium] brassicae (nom. inval.)]|nr:hypothetical protein PybrP1_007505 [[Pythium] brassicae (nom. inval.)]
MMRISDLLNSGDQSDEEQVAQIVDAQYRDEPVKLRRAASASQYNDVQSRRDYEDDASSGVNDTGRLSETTSYASSLLDALSLQSMAKLSSKRSPTALLMRSSPNQGRFLNIQQLTNPDDTNGMKQEEGTAATSQPPSSKKRSTRSLFPAATDSDRRAKQRMIVKRCYYKKIDTIKTLREEVEGLEQQFLATMQSRKQQNEEIVTAALQDGEEVDDATKLSELYMQSLTAKEALRKENQRLRRLADEYYMKNQGRLRILLDSDKKGIPLFTPALDN